MLLLLHTLPTLLLSSPEEATSVVERLKEEEGSCLLLRGSTERLMLALMGIGGTRGWIFSTSGRSLVCLLPIYLLPTAVEGDTCFDLIG